MPLDQNKKLTVFGLIFAVAIGIVFYFYNILFVPTSAEDLLAPLSEDKISFKSDQILEKPSFLFVHVCGAVKNKGVYKVKSGTRIFDVIKLAGGVLPYANVSSINLAEETKDGQKIMIPFVEDVVVQPLSKEYREKQEIKTNLNTASINELDSLPGIGPATALQIIKARPFSSIEDLLKIKRFGRNKLDKIREKITI